MPPPAISDSVTAVCSEADLGRINRCMIAYSEDLRRKKIADVVERGMLKSEVARLFGVSLSFVQRALRQDGV